MIRRPPRSTLFPTRRSSDLSTERAGDDRLRSLLHLLRVQLLARCLDRAWLLDRKSTRLNSSHLVISYAVFCLKKKKQRYRTRRPTFASTHPLAMIPIHCTT